MSNTSEPKKRNTTRKFFSEWLEQLQQESWQLELLISGFALFGIWESRVLITHLQEYLMIYGTGSMERYLNTMVLIFKFGWVAFFCNLLLHIILRGLWIGAIGLRYVSGDINYESLDYNVKYENFLRKKIGSFDDYIEKLEKFSSVIFSYTFLLFFMFISAISIFIAFISMGQIGELIFGEMEGSRTTEAFIGILFLVLLIFGGIVFFDFITLGKIKKSKDPILTKLYYPLYRFFGYISLSFLYRPLLYNFIDEKFTKRLFLLAIPYGLFLGIIFPGFYFQPFSFFPSFNHSIAYSEQVDQLSYSSIFYDDLREQQYAASGGGWSTKMPIHYISLESYELTKDDMRFFLRLSDSDSELIKHLSPQISPFFKEGFRHNFLRNQIKDPSNTALRDKEVREADYMRSVIRDRAYTHKDSTEFLSQREYYSNYSLDDIPELREEIRDKYVKQRVEQFAERIQEIKESMQGLYSISIDQVSYNDSLECSFYVHPNLQEKGLLCYAPISHMALGSHEIQLRKKYYDDSVKDSIGLTDTQYIAFRKRSKE